MVSLPSDMVATGTSLETAIGNRRSIREFTADALTPEQIGQLAWAGQGITSPRRGLRAAPSAGATYPLELYVVSDHGVFRYLPDSHALQQVSQDDKRGALADAALGQRWVANAAVNIVLTAVYERTAARYGQRARRYVHMEAGHAAQNILLTAVSLDLGAVPVGAFDDSRAAAVLGVPDSEHVVYIISVGVPDVGR